MPVATEQISLGAPPGSPELLSSIIHEYAGILFEADRFDILLEKIEPLARARGCASFLEYYYLLKYRENGREDWNRVMDALSVQESYFWREMGQIQAFTTRVAPAWIAKSSLPLRIWSAACATGEEPYTIVMNLLEAGVDRHAFEVHASDMSSAALEKARAGVFRERSFRSLPPEYREKYFTPAAHGWKIHPEIMQRVQFHQANLLAADEIESLARCPVVFCRNVFIYFSRHAIRQTLATFARRMPAGGHLFVGAAESLLRLTVDFELRELGEAFAYVRI